MTSLKNTLFIFALLFLSSCAVNQENYTIPTDAYIVSKFLVRDEFSSPKITTCPHEIPDFKEFTNECSFLLAGMEFDIQQRFNVDRNGVLEEFLTYKSEGALHYSLKNLEAYTTYYNNLGLKDFNLSFSKDKKYIIDSFDTLEIERIFPNEKLIFTKRTQKQIEDNRRVIYQFESISN